MYSTEIEKVLRKHWNETAVLIDTLHPDTDGQELNEADLLPGELSAVICKVGCYIVRSAQRVYKIHEPGYSPELETPASKEETELVKSDNDLFPSWRDSLRVVHEISAKHQANPNQEFTFICRAAQARNYGWIETISCICTAKEYGLVPNEYASLFVLNTYVGSSFSVDYWYMLAPTGKIMTLKLHPFDQNMDNARFT